LRKIVPPGDRRRAAPAGWRECAEFTGCAAFITFTVLRQLLPPVLLPPVPGLPVLGLPVLGLPVLGLPVLGLPVLGLPVLGIHSARSPV